MRQVGFIKKYVNVRGKSLGDVLCNRLTARKQGAWAMQYQWWPNTDNPMNMGLLMMPIPNTPYEIQVFYPTRLYTEKQLNAFLMN